VNWDPKLQTAISDLEVEQIEVKGNLWHLRYPLEGSPGPLHRGRDHAARDDAGRHGVAVHPEDERYKHLIGKNVRAAAGRPPDSDRRRRVCRPREGSGAVKITPAHDFNDFEVGKRHNLPLINIFDRACRCEAQRERARSCIAASTASRRASWSSPSWKRWAAREDRAAHPHAVPHGDRSGVVIEPWLTDQWYVDAATLAKPAIAAVEQGETVFVPKHWEKTYFEWMRNIQPWCISRQLWWGHQIPAWYGPDGKVFVAEETKRKRKAAAHGITAGRREALTRDPDVLDTWFSSALWPFSTLGWPDQTPN
jgi:valyl-tRNA synthetase